MSRGGRALSALFSRVRPHFEQPVEEPARGGAGMVVAYHPLARRAGEGILDAGGNAADAFVAAAVAENVLAEGASSLAGPLMALVYRSGGPAGPEVVSLDADFDHPLDDRQRCTASTRARGKAVLVPGAPLGLWELARAHGSLPFATLLEPAAALAEEGFPVNHLMAGLLRWRRKVLGRTAYGRATFFRDGRTLCAGELLRQPELAAFLRRFGQDGPDDVYRGPWGRRFLDTVAEEGGFLGADDLARYEVRRAAPWTVPYRGHALHATSGASFGGVWVLLALRVWEHARSTAGARGWSEAERLGWMIRIAQHVWAEPYLLDPASIADAEFVRSRLADAHAAEIWERVRAGAGARARPMGGGGAHSYHLIARDGEGKVVSGTTTINSPPWGDGVFVEGVPLTAANRIPWGSTPGARRITPVTAQLALREGVPAHVVGTISNSLLEAAFQVLVNLIDEGMSPAEAVTAPRFGTFPTGRLWRRNLPVLDRTWLDPRIPDAVVRAVKKSGLKVVRSGAIDTGLGAVLSITDDVAEGVTIPLPYVSQPFESPI
ncbi:MAG TPA: gamma-glutamyltransferase [Longimicrobium sp.]|nr:gamma-glutamyltransferase [Longimicrobium sp.]